MDRGTDDGERKVSHHFNFCLCLEIFSMEGGVTSKFMP